MSRRRYISQHLDVLFRWARFLGNQTCVRASDWRCSCVHATWQWKASLPPWPRNPATPFEGGALFHPFAEEKLRPRKGKRLLFPFYPQSDAFYMTPAPRWESLKCQNWRWDSTFRDHWPPVILSVAPHLPALKRKTPGPPAPMPSQVPVDNAWVTQSLILRQEHSFGWWYKRGSQYR